MQCAKCSVIRKKKAKISLFFQFYFQDSKVEVKKPRSWEKSQGVATLSSNLSVNLSKGRCHKRSKTGNVHTLLQ